MAKEYDLPESSTHLLIYTRNHLDAIFSGLLSTIANDRLNYKVTDKTQFKLNANMTKVTMEEEDDGAIGEAKEEKKD